MNYKFKPFDISDIRTMFKIYKTLYKTISSSKSLTNWLYPLVDHLNPRYLLLEQLYLYIVDG